MMVMIGDHGNRHLHDLAIQHPGRLGWIMGPTHFRKPKANTPYALDNDAYIAWTNHYPWDEGAWLNMLTKAWASGVAPLWCLVPDVVANKVETLENWARYRDFVTHFGWGKGFAVQDGMTTKDVPCDADIVFVGGTTHWKWRTALMWTETFPRVHIGRVHMQKLLVCERLGAESVDGSGWFRGTPDSKPARYLKAWLAGHIKPHPELAF